MRESDTATRLLDAAQVLVQERGFNAFSYKDLAAAVGIRTASIHYHFPAKADLGHALMARYLTELEEALRKIDDLDRPNKAKLEAFVDLYRATEDRGAICLCGSLAADLETLPEDLRSSVMGYLDRSERWIADRIDDGVRAGEFTISGSSTDIASALVASLQGALILARAQKGPSSVVEKVERSFLAALGAS